MRFIIREMQHVLVEREVEADDEDQALAKFWDEDGSGLIGTPCGRDGEMTYSTLLSVEPI